MSFPVSARLFADTTAVIFIALFTIPPVVARGGVVYYSSQSSFNAAATGLPVDTLSGVASHNYTSPFSDISGLSYGTGSTSVSNDLIVQGNSISSSYFGQPIVLTFSPPVKAVGAFVFGQGASGQTPASSFTVDVYNGTTLESTVPVAASSSDFFGVTSTTPITRVDFLYNDNADAYTFVNNVAFGSLPEPSSILLLAAAAFPLVRRSRI